MSSAPPPIPCTWDGESFVPLKRFGPLCDRHFVVGEVHPMVVQEQRSQASHGHYFAALTNAWNSLPDHLAERFPSVEALRKYALIKAGYADERSIVAASKAEARRIAAFIRPMDEFAVVTVSEVVVTVYTAKSQSMRAMGKVEFGASKSAVLDIVAEMIAVTPSDLKRSTGEAT